MLFSGFLLHIVHHIFLIVNMILVAGIIRAERRQRKAIQAGAATPAPAPARSSSPRDPALNALCFIKLC